MNSKDSKGRFAKGFSHNKGKKMSEETKLKISIAKKGKPNKAITKFTREGTLGANHWNWKGWQTKEERDWQKNVRVRAKRANGGSHSLSEWHNLKAQYNWTCPCCYKQEPEIKLSQDHIIPVSKGGSDNIENIQPLCMPCNLRKHTRVIKYIKNN